MQKTLQQVEQILASDLIAAYKYTKHTKEILVLIVQEKPFQTLSAISNVICKTPFILLSQEEVQGSSDVFPIQFVAIQETATLLSGKDIFADILVKKEDMRRKLEYDFRNKNIYLREEYLLSPISSLLKNIIPELYPSLLGLLYLYGEKNISDTQEIISAVQEKTGVDMTAFTALVQEKTFSTDEEYDMLSQTSMILEKLGEVTHAFPLS